MRIGRRERKIMRLNDEIAALRREEALVREELVFHRHLNDDAQRDAAVSEHPIDRADAAETASDVARFERQLDRLASTREKLEARRMKLLERLG